MDLACLLILALAVSIDSFGVGVTYGFRKIQIPISSTFIISLASAIMILFSMQIGVWINLLLSPEIAKWIGSIILILIGLWVIIQVLIQNNKENEPIYDNRKQETNLISIEIKRLGLVIQILRTPTKADMDKSGNISAIEAVFLGLALSLDAFGAGLGAALVGFKPLLTAIIIAGMSGFFIILGLKIGFILSGIKWVKKISILPGIIMVIIGVMKIF